ncbi:MAG: hypothetical protein JZU63_07970, partial [Rhodoferax sp.]|nr:hypothetical protein [Rhodoferax sp.]
RHAFEGFSQTSLAHRTELLQKLQAAFERQSENKSLYNHLKLSSINPVAPPLKNCLHEEISKESVQAAEARSHLKKPSIMPPETTAEDDLPNFDTF